jgi:glycosyltransferase involved in cell wall biosynthesis
VRIPPSLLYESWRHLGAPTLRAPKEVDLWHLTVPVPPPRISQPLVSTVHDLLPITSPEYFTGRGADLMTRGIERIRAESAAITVPSQVVAEQCRANGFPAARLHVVPWGFTPTVAGADAQRRVLDKYALLGPIVLFVGTIEPRKGLDVLVEALSLMWEPATLVVVGPPGWGDMDQGARDVISRSGKSVRFLGFIPTADLRALQSAADVACVPSFEEGFGLPALEAMGQGAPVVTTQGTAMAEVVGDAAKLVPVGDPAALGLALDEVLGDDALRARLVDAGRERAAGYTWSNSADAMARVYAKVLHRG